MEVLVQIKEVNSMIKTKEFFSVFTDKSVEMLNEFLAKNDIEYVDLKVFDGSHFLLIYKEKGDE